MARLAGLPLQLFKRLMLRGSAFKGSYGKLRTLYTLEDPWGMSSDKEQHRFEETNRQLINISPNYPRILELGCGEGHQTVFLARLTDHIYGLDVSEKAVLRARRRLPRGIFHAGCMEDVNNLFPDETFSLVTACEVLYYAKDPARVLSVLQGCADNIYVSNYAERAHDMMAHFSGPGWSRLSPIRHENTVWECHLWQSSQTGCT